MTKSKKEELKKGCGKIFGDSFYHDMNPTKCGNSNRYCRDCREHIQIVQEAKKEFLEFLKGEVNLKIDLDIDKISAEEYPNVFLITELLNNQNNRFKEKIAELEK